VDVGVGTKGKLMEKNIYTYKQWCDANGRKENSADNLREFLALKEKERDGK